MQRADPDFEFVRRMGKGGNGEVWEALYKPSGKEAAVKIVALEGGADSEIHAECRMLQQLDSKYILKYYASSAKQKEFWVVTELCSAGSVRDVIAKCGPFPELQAVVILKQLLKALEFIHSRTPPIAHRDIKAGNVLIHENGRVKLGDFGIAAHDTGHLHTQIGSPYWLAPEMLPSPEASNTVPTYDYRVDIWSLGITAIELVQGKPPLMALSAVQALFQMATTKVAPTLDEPQFFSANYNSFIAACLQRDPKQRPSAATLREHPLITSAGSRELLEDYLENRYRFRRTDSPAHPSPSGARPRAQAAPASAMLSDDSSDDEEPLQRSAPSATKTVPTNANANANAAAAAASALTYPFLTSTPYAPQLCRPSAEHMPYTELVKSKKQREKEQKEKEREKEKEKERHKEREQRLRTRPTLKDVPMQLPKGPLHLVEFDITLGVPQSLLSAADPTGPARSTLPDTQHKSLTRSMDLLPLVFPSGGPMIAATRSVSPRPGSHVSPTDKASQLPFLTMPTASAPATRPTAPTPSSPRQTGSSSPRSAAAAAAGAASSPRAAAASTTSSASSTHLSMSATAPVPVLPPSILILSSPAPTSFVTAVPSAGRPFRPTSPGVRRADLTNSAPPPTSPTASSPMPIANSLSLSFGVPSSPPTLRSSGGPVLWASWSSFFAQTGLPEADCKKYSQMFIEQMVELEQIPHLNESFLKRLIPAAHLAPILRLAQSNASAK